MPDLPPEGVPPELGDLFESYLKVQSCGCKLNSEGFLDHSDGPNENGTSAARPCGCRTELSPDDALYRDELANSPLQVRESLIEGRGLFATRDIKAGELIATSQS